MIQLDATCGLAYLGIAETVLDPLMPTLLKIDRLLIGLIVLTLVASVMIYLIDRDYFHLSFAAEDRLVENGTALFLFIASVVLANRSARLGAQGRKAGMLLMGFYALLFFLASGEEISWGQRIFGWESGEFFQQHNKQDETNFHNLMVGDASLARTLFGNFLTVVLLLYLVFLPLLYPRIQMLRRLADRLVIPVPGLRHAALALIASLIIAALDVPRKWEVYELVFSLLAVSIFLLPQNRDALTS